MLRSTALPLLVVATALLGTTPSPAHAAVKLRRTAQTIEISTPQLRISCSLTTGLCDYQWIVGAALRGVSCAARLSDGRQLNAWEYPQHRCDKRDVVSVTDAFGKGLRITLHHRAAGAAAGPELRQHLWVYEGQPYCMMDVEIASGTPLASNDITPLVLDAARTPGAGLQLATGGQPQILRVPFDNDGYVRYNGKDLTRDGISYEVGAVYDRMKQLGVVLGSVTHEVWKTGIAMHDVAAHGVGSLRVFGGATGKLTRDTQPHGMVAGTVITSPRIFVGAFADWRDGMEAFGRANATLHPPLAWIGGVPFGWNSWAAYGTKVNYDRYVAVSDFFKAQLQPHGFANGDLNYINFDSFWDNLQEPQLIEAARHVHANGQKAGIYWTPFTDWGDNMKRPVEGSDGRYTYGDIVLKDSAGNPLPKNDSGHPLDPTHPGTLARIDWQMQRFVRWGYDYVKLDFVHHGAFEGAHYDKRYPTGIAAYNVGMQRIVTDLDPRKIGRPFFISLSIAPLFPGGYAHSRRISCDTFGSLDNTEYMLNSLTYGWWMNGTLYRYNDPDHVVLYRREGKGQPSSEEVARTRLNSAVIAGTVLLDSDDLTDPDAQARVEKLLSNPEINALARSGRTFRPVEGDSGEHATDVFVCREDINTCTVAVFNFDANLTVGRRLDLAQLCKSEAPMYTVRDLWTGHDSHRMKILSIELEPGASKLLRVTGMNLVIH